MTNALIEFIDGKNTVGNERAIDDRTVQRTCDLSVVRSGGRAIERSSGRVICRLCDPVDVRSISPRATAACVDRF
ncbi:hypothetical protein EL22_11945 [Halostagnicola sp. A56]|nr:hypothetical protein EL22_11945 [Halostagnicola sp. A56]